MFSTLCFIRFQLRTGLKIEEIGPIKEWLFFLQAK